MPFAPYGPAPAMMPMGGGPGNQRNAIAQAIIGQRRMGGNAGAGSMMRPGGPAPPAVGGMNAQGVGGMTPAVGAPPPGAGMNAFNQQLNNMAGPGAPAAPGAPMSLAPPPQPGAMSSTFAPQGLQGIY